jgi:hypothetical protein
MRAQPIDLAGRIAKYLLILAVVLYGLDWIIFAERRTVGSGMGSVPVEQYLQTNLKGNKAEYDYMGTTNQSCGRTIFPQYAGSQWNVPCWWLAQHKAQWQ